jgi:hypothetical protein
MLLNLFLYSSFEEVGINPKIYLNRGPRVEIFTLDRGKPFTICVVEIVDHLSKLELKMAIKLDVDKEEIEKALKASELQDKVA